MDPDARAHLDSVAASGIPPVEQLSPAEARAIAERAAPALAGPAPQLDRVEDRVIASPAGDVPVRLFAPAAAGPLPVVVWFHGGGWVIGSLDTHDGVGRRLAAQASCLVVSVGYRLAPEHRYPAAVDDSWAATEWLAEQAGEWGGDRFRIAVGGDSAGGNLAAVVALRARDRGLQLAAQLLVYPVLDSDLETASYRRNASGQGLTAASMAWYWDQYLPDLSRRSEPEASPLRAPDLAGVAPALVVVCDLDPLYDEGVAYARRLEAAGVSVKLSSYEGMIHGFIRMAAGVRRSQDLMAELAGYLADSFKD